MSKIISVLRLITANGDAFYSADHSPELIAEILKRRPNWQLLELISMDEDEYKNIPTTTEAAELFKGLPTEVKA